MVHGVDVFHKVSIFSQRILGYFPDVSFEVCQSTFILCLTFHQIHRWFTGKFFPFILCVCVSAYSLDLLLLTVCETF